MRSSSCPPAGEVRLVTTARGFSLPVPSSTSGLPPRSHLRQDQPVKGPCG
jgi:hypothetical protein